MAVQLLIERVLDKSDLRLLRIMTKRVGVAGSAKMALYGATRGRGQYMLWEIAR
jgi:hypothetical protein